MNPRRYVSAIARSGLTIYDPIEVGHPDLWIPTPELQAVLDDALRGVPLADLPLRTRSKAIKAHVCRALGYPVPTSFRKTRPRFPGQAFDTYGQKANNLQVWNEELAPTRRYVLIRISDAEMIARVRVVTGDTLALLDTTGTLTQKYQARCIPGGDPAELIASRDTDLLCPFLSAEVDLGSVATPVHHPQAGQLLPIATIFDRLKVLIGTTFRDTGSVQERKRGRVLHRLACRALGYSGHEDDGQFPDVRHQLVEVKLQTAPTIDLGLVTPDSSHALDVPQIGKTIIRHCDVRYAILYGTRDGTHVMLTHLFLTTGEAFFTRFPRFGGKVLNKKLQIPLPSDFFDV